MCLGLCAALPTAAWSLGPAQPFMPPAPAAAASAAETTADAEPAVHGLAGVRLGKAPAALIDGLWLRVGEPVRGATLQRIEAQRVWLRHADGHTELLALYPLPTAQPDGPSLFKRTLP
jgi:hypothetical protein